VQRQIDLRCRARRGLTGPGPNCPRGCGCWSSSVVFQVSQAVYAVAKLGIATALVNGPLPLTELAKATETNPEALGRLVRTLTPLGIFRATGDGEPSWPAAACPTACGQSAGTSSRASRRRLPARLRAARLAGLRVTAHSRDDRRGGQARRATGGDRGDRCRAGRAGHHPRCPLLARGRRHRSAGSAEPLKAARSAGPPRTSRTRSP
jgi:hypothetical protein